MTDVDRRGLPALSRCIACGRCDCGESERVAASRGAYPGLMQLTLASSRCMPDFDAGARAIAHVPAPVLASKTGRCPVGMPFSDLARFLQSKAQVAAGATGSA